MFCVPDKGNVYVFVSLIRGMFIRWASRGLRDIAVQVLTPGTACGGLTGRRFGPDVPGHLLHTVTPYCHYLAVGLAGTALCDILSLDERAVCKKPIR